MSDPVHPLFDTDMSKLMAGFRLPGIDTDSLVATQRRNFEALTAANQLAVEGLQTIARRQAEIIRAGIEEATALLRDLSRNQTTEERMARQTEAAKQALDKALVNARELSELVARASNEAYDVINRRLGEQLDEVRALVTRAAAATKTTP
jgi:phasin family protein